MKQGNKELKRLTEIMLNNINSAIENSVQENQVNFLISEGIEIKSVKLIGHVYKEVKFGVRVSELNFLFNEIPIDIWYLDEDTEDILYLKDDLILEQKIDADGGGVITFSEPMKSFYIDYLIEIDFESAFDELFNIPISFYDFQ